MEKKFGLLIVLGMILFACTPVTAGAESRNVLSDILQAQDGGFSGASVFIAVCCVISLLSILLFIILRDRKKLRISRLEIQNFNDLRQAFINAEDSLIYLKDENLKYVFVNRAFESFFQDKGGGGCRA